MADLDEDAVFDAVWNVFRKHYDTRLAVSQPEALFRARPNKGAKLWENISDVWIPPKTEVTERGRFNSVGESKFYGAVNPEAALFELYPESGQYMTLLVIGAREKSSVLKCGSIGIQHSKLGPDFWGELHGGPAASPGFMDHFPDDKSKSNWIALDKYFSEMSVSKFDNQVKQDQYKISIAIARSLSKISESSGIIYPSVASDLHSMNFCLKPDCAKKYFFPTEVWLLRVGHGVDSQMLDSSQMTLEAVRASKSIAPDGTIDWSEEHHLQLSDIREADSRVQSHWRANGNRDFVWKD